jgi:hypothetical protein
MLIFCSALAGSSSRYRLGWRALALELVSRVGSSLLAVSATEARKRRKKRMRQFGRRLPACQTDLFAGWICLPSESQSAPIESGRFHGRCSGTATCVLQGDEDEELSSRIRHAPPASDRLPARRGLGAHTG